MDTQQTNTQQSFTKESIIAYLAQKSICGVIDTNRLSELLGTISTRMLRNFAYTGKLKAIDNTATFYVFKVEDVADWLLQYPRYLFGKTVDNSDMTVERINSLTAYIKDYVNHHYRAILKLMPMDDVVMEVLAIICRKRHKDVSDATMVFRALYTIYRKNANRQNEVTMEPNAIEQMFAGENDND